MGKKALATLKDEFDTLSIKLTRHGVCVLLDGVQQGHDVFVVVHLAILVTIRVDGRGQWLGSVVLREVVGVGACTSAGLGWVVDHQVRRIRSARDSSHGIVRSG